MKKVLVVDDEPMCARFLSAALTAEGFEVKSSTRADEAIAVGTAFRPDFLITDWMLKDSKDGIEVARSLAQVLPTVQVIFITGMAEELLKKQTEGLPCRAIVVKPLDLDHVVSLLRD